MLIASECERHRGMHISAENLYVEVIKDGREAKPGEVGEVVITDLHNYGMPFIRYKNEDLGRMSVNKCSCGRGLPLLEKIEGRVVDMIKTPNGKILTGLFFPHLMKDFREIEKFQVIQSSLDSLTVKIQSDKDHGAVPINTIRSIIRQCTGKSMRINIEIVDEIPLSPSGKFRVVISHIRS